MAVQASIRVTIQGIKSPQRTEYGVTQPRLSLLNFRNNLPTEQLKPETIESIWKWADDPASFFVEKDRTANPLPAAGALLTPLDSVCLLLNHLETRVQLDRIRRRLLLYLLAWMVETKIQVGTHDDVASVLVQSQLISNASQKSIAGNLRDWLARGRQYLHLAKRLGKEGEEGEAGAVIFLPMWKGESVWYHHSHVGGGNGDEIIAWLRASKVTEDARRTHEYRNAHGVVKTLSANDVVKGLRAALDGNLLFRHEVASPSPPMPFGSRIRSSRQLPSPVIPSSPPILGQPAGQELLPRHAMNSSQSSPDAGSCALGEPSPSESLRPPSSSRGRMIVTIWAFSRHSLDAVPTPSENQLAHRERSCSRLDNAKGEALRRDQRLLMSCYSVPT